MASKKTEETAKKATKKAAPKAEAKGATKKVVVKKATKKAAAKRTKAAPAPAVERKEPPSKKTALAIAEAGLEKKAVNIQIIDVFGKVDYADYLVVMSGRSDRQVAALARGIAEDVEKNVGEKCAGIEGLPEGAWVLMDFGDVVVHIFHDDVRGYYDLESLWIDAARVPVPNQPAV
ncbi:MAG: ribosome silencing factor [Sandaracinaceae bacterium]|nr:ribosome silencing factor [Sandaracinaceae bacterium]